jgi:hypothetical protein
MNSRAIVIAVFAATTLAAGCTSPRVPDDSAPPVIVHVAAGQEWTATGVRVHKDDWLFVTATGEIYWSAHQTSAGPDGIGGSPGWLNTGGLIGRVAASGRTFDIGARTKPFRSHDMRSQATYPAPPIRMPADGELTLGFKEYTAGANSGGFEVTIRRARQP